MKKTVTVIVALILIFACLIFAFADGEDAPKKDVGSSASALTQPGEWAKKEIEKGFDIGILDRNKTYYYASPITREEFCEVIYKLYIRSDTIEIIENPVNKFSDTQNTNVIYLSELGVIKGKSDTVFAPDDYLTREEAATILTRLLNLFPEIRFPEMWYEYDDEESISEWAVNSVQVMANLGIMEGTGNKVFAPKAIYWTQEALVSAVRTAEIIGIQKEIDGNTFADRLNYLMPHDENYLFSPLSIKMALALAANGAKGETKQEILDAALIKDLDKFNEQSKDLISRYTQTDALSLAIANSVWVNTNNSPLDFSSSYKETVSSFYKASAKQVDNGNAVKEINGWVKDKTNCKIPSIINDSDFWAALINAIYFKGAWENEFHKGATKPDIFYNNDGTTSKIDFMNQTDLFSYAKSDKTEIIRLPYKNSFAFETKEGEYKEEYYRNLNISMYLIKAKEAEPEEILNQASFSSERIKLSVPKFKIEYSTELCDTLKNLGMEKAFSEYNADFSGMMNLRPEYRLWIDKILHKTYISVDEEGTEAAAVTAIMMAGATSAKPKEPIEVKFDTPFYFVIRDDTNGEVLFIGRHAYAE